MLKRILRRIRSEPETLSGKTLALSAANALGMLSNLVTPVVLVRILSKHDYGVLGMIFVITSLFHSIIGLNVNNGAAYFLPRKELSRDATLAGIMAFNLVSGGLALAWFVWFPAPIEWLFRSDSLASYTWMMGLILFVWNLSRGMSLVPIALGKSAATARYIALTESTKSLFILTPAVVFGELVPIVIGFLFWSMFRAAVALAYFHFALNVSLKHFDWTALRRILAYAIPFGITGILAVVFQQYHYFLVGHHFDEEAIAVLRVGTAQLPLLMTIFESSLNIAAPEMARLQGRRDYDGMVRLIARIFVKLSVLFVPTLLFLMLMAKEFISAMFTSEYLAGLPIFRINLLGILTMLIALDPTIRAFEQLRYFRLKLSALTVLALVALGNIVVNEFGLSGAVALTISARLLVQGACLLRLWPLLGFKWSHVRWLSELKYVARGCVVAAVGALLVRTALISAFGPAETLSESWAALVVLCACGAVFAALYLIGFEGGLGLGRIRAVSGIATTPKP